MKVLKHIAMAGFIAFLLSPEKSRQREDDHEHNNDIVVVIDDDGYRARVCTNSSYGYIKISGERSVSFIAERLEIEADYCLLNGVTMRESNYDRPLSEIIGSASEIQLSFINKIENA